MADHSLTSFVGWGPDMICAGLCRDQLVNQLAPNIRVINTRCEHIVLMMADSEGLVLIILFRSPILSQQTRSKLELRLSFKRVFFILSSC